MDVIKSTDFSKYLFWDTNLSMVDLERNAPYIVQRILEYGEVTDWHLLLKYYGLKRIVEIAKELRCLDSHALAFLCAVSKTREEDYRCYLQTPLTAIQ